MTTPHPLDRPVWSALTSGWSRLAQGSPERALRLDPAYGPFGAPRDLSPSGMAGLLGLDFAEEGVWLVEREAVPPPAGAVIAGTADVVQMVADKPKTAAPDFDVVELTDADGPEMLALALLTKPGPFHRRTHQLSQFLGVKVDGRLAAMAGERMRLPGYAEVSGVCTHPDFRGKGYAAGLMRLVNARIVARGETPFLHAYSANAAAIALHESLGFRRRIQLPAVILKRA